ncbi:MAG: hypothetical protein HFH74_16730 [Lachnospiraceae bacterium]|nr:hypothetical protein [Lachnospiraceae bacterium]
MTNNDKRERSAMAFQYSESYRSAFYENNKLRFGWAFFLCIVMQLYMLFGYYYEADYRYSCSRVS